MDLLMTPLIAGTAETNHDSPVTHFAPHLDWRAMNPRDHFVQFYETENNLMASVTGFIASGLNSGEECIVIATEDHRVRLNGALADLGIDVNAVLESGLNISIDAALALTWFMHDGSPDPKRFQESVGKTVIRAASTGRPVRAFGEMVALLWSAGNHAGAIRLEELWHDLSESHAFALFCAYPMQGFDCETHSVPFSSICSSHSRVIPAESYVSLSTSNDRLREISNLQQKAQALEAEIARRKCAEKALEGRLAEIEELNARLRRAVTETHHRVKNNLQFMSALIEMQKHTNRDLVPMSEFVRLGQNVQALAVIHDLLTHKAREDGQAKCVSAKAVLEQLLPLVQGALGDCRIECSVADVQVPGKQATALALITNELVSNGVKHGSHDVEISLESDGEYATLMVCDNGPGFPPEFDADTAAHTGLDLVQNIARFDLRAQTKYENRGTGGAVVSVVFPLVACAA